MRKYILTILVILAHSTAYATDGLICEGKEYYVYMSVGSDNIVDSSVVTDNKTRKEETFRLKEVSNVKFKWLNSYGNTGNSMILHFIREGKIKYVVTATGAKGKIKNSANSFPITCTWER